MDWDCVLRNVEEQEEISLQFTKLLKDLTCYILAKESVSRGQIEMRRDFIAQMVVNR